MDGIFSWFSAAYDAVGGVSPDLLLIIALASYGGVFLIALISCLASQRMRAAEKRPYLYFTNAFTAVIFAAFSARFDVARAAAFTALFWCAGYLLYGLLSALTRKPAPAARAAAQVVSAMQIAPPKETYYADVPAARNVVRLEHALSIADKLLLKNLGKGDRQELERMKSTLAVLQAKGNLTPQEGEVLNDNFNALLKLMAKYNI